MPLRGLLNRAINALPFELHIPGYQFCGPGTRLEKRLARGDRGINPLDAAYREHDIAYSHSNELAKRHTADKLLAEEARKHIVTRDSSLGERAAATVVWVMKVKTKFGMGLKTRKRKSKRILPITKRGGVLPILPLLDVLGSLVGGAAGVAKAVNDNKAAQHQLQELQRHNRVMEGRGVYLPTTADEVSRVEKKRRRDVKTAKGCNYQRATAATCKSYAKRMRTTLPVEGVHRNESGIVNLDNAKGPGTHWVAYAKRGNRAIYFDSFGNLRPPKELERYLVNSVIEYNRTHYQRYNQSNCGQQCLQFLRTVDKQFKDRYCTV
ncbi:hypothetical protein ALC60_10221 [Trachymyrmex zeteki]|uniref:Phospholipase A2-like domain-containing protein n=1 Tax=Mycetomoellerius zeteki TaxID=64791 RepID=A0A151WS77_9HYME|nr:hypothetical protein ALC60_10221 [Trachymyrmex zeteki]